MTPLLSSLLVCLAITRCGSVLASTPSTNTTSFMYSPQRECTKCSESAVSSGAEVSASLLAVGVLAADRSSSDAFVAVVQASDLGERNDGPKVWGLDSPWFGSVLSKREMRPAPEIIAEIARQDSSQVGLTEHDRVIQAIMTYRAN